ncbi:uncharacterized protein [Periplaneta americana]|uniref:uncharacterized protein n=1 Tax=Periplaneta americana TaxID=6978 RepID=UPI0037E79CAC
MGGFRRGAAELQHPQTFVAHERNQRQGRIGEATSSPGAASLVSDALRVTFTPPPATPRHESRVSRRCKICSSLRVVRSFKYIFFNVRETRDKDGLVKPLPPLELPVSSRMLCALLLPLPLLPLAVNPEFPGAAKFAAV